MKGDKTQVRAIEQEVLTLLDAHLREYLPFVLASVFGRAVIDTGSDASIRYTAMINDLFVKVLNRKKRPDAFWRARSVKVLRSWVSVTVANQIRDHFKRKKIGKRVMEAIAALAEERQRHFFQSTGLELDEDVLEQIVRWRDGDDPRLAQLARVLLHRYIDGMTYEQISDQLDITSETLYRLREEGIRRLRAEFATQFAR